MLDNFIEKAYEGWFDMLGDPNSDGCFPCILQTTGLGSVSHGSRKPMPDFESPFLNMTDNESRDWMQTHQHRNFCHSIFTVLDQNTAERQVSRIGYIDEKLPDDWMLWVDFYVDLYVRVPIKMGTLSWWEEDFVGTEEVLNEKSLKRMMEKAKKRS